MKSSVTEAEFQQMCQKMSMIIWADTLLNTHPPRCPLSVGLVKAPTALAFCYGILRF